MRIASVLRQLQASAIPECAIAITLEVDESLHVNADEVLLTSAVTNLLHNAVKFSGAGAPRGRGAGTGNHAPRSRSDGWPRLD